MDPAVVFLLTPILLILLGLILRTDFFKNKHVDHRMIGRMSVALGIYFAFGILVLLAILDQSKEKSGMKIAVAVFIAGSVLLAILDKLDNKPVDIPLISDIAGIFGKKTY